MAGENKTVLRLYMSVYMILAAFATGSLSVCKLGHGSLRRTPDARTEVVLDLERI